MFGFTKRRGVVPAALVSLVAAIAFAWAPAPAVAAPSPAPVTVQGQTVEQKPPTGVYCTPTITKRCLKAPTVTITPSCLSGAGRAVIAFNNTNSVGAPTEIGIVYSAGTFTNPYTAPPGASSVPINGFPAGDNVEITVKWSAQNLIFGRKQFVACG